MSDEVAKGLQEMLRKLFSSFPSDEYNGMIEGPAFHGMMTEYDKFFESQINSKQTFAVWSSRLDYAKTVLPFTLTSRESDWELHLAAVRFLLPWMFAYDRTNYARYLPVYGLEMKGLVVTHPYI